MDREHLVEAMAHAIAPTVLKYVSGYEDVPPDHIWTRPRYQWLSFAVVQIVNAAITAIEADGFAIVPKEPTEVMINAGEAIDGTITARDVYHAMIEAV